MVSNYIFYQDAANDLEEIIKYISETLKNKEAAQKLLLNFESKIDSVLNFPYMYPIIEHPRLQERNIRKCKVESYLIVYKVNELKDQIEIIRVIYSREDFI